MVQRNMIHFKDSSSFTCNSAHSSQSLNLWSCQCACLSPEAKTDTMYGFCVETEVVHVTIDEPGYLCGDCSHVGGRLRVLRHHGTLTPVHHQHVGILLHEIHKVCDCVCVCVCVCV